MDSTENKNEQESGMEVDDGIDFPEEMLEWDVVDEASDSEEDTSENKAKETKAKAAIDAKVGSPSKTPVLPAGAEENPSVGDLDNHESTGAKDVAMMDESGKEEASAADESMSESPKTEQTTTRRSSRTRAAASRQSKTSPVKAAESPKTTKQTRKGNTRSQKLMDDTDKTASDVEVGNKPETAVVNDQVSNSDTTELQSAASDNRSTEAPAEPAAVTGDTNVDSTNNTTDKKQSETKQDDDNSTSKKNSPKKVAAGRGTTKKTDTTKEATKQAEILSETESTPESKSDKSQKKDVAEKQTEVKAIEEEDVGKSVVTDEKVEESPSKQRVTRSHLAQATCNNKTNQKEKATPAQSSDKNVENSEAVFKSPAQVTPKKNTGKGANAAKTKVGKQSEQGNGDGGGESKGKSAKSPAEAKSNTNMADTPVKKTDHSKKEEAKIEETPDEAGTSTSAAVKKTAVSRNGSNTSKEKSSDIIVIDSDTDDDPKKTLVVKQKSSEPLQEITTFSQLKESPIEVSVELEMKALKETEVYLAFSHSQSFKIDFPCRATRPGKATLVYWLDKPEKKKIILKVLATLSVIGLEVKVPRLLENSLREWEKKLGFKLRQRKDVLKIMSHPMIKQEEETLIQGKGHPKGRSMYVANVPIAKATNVEKKLKERFPKAIRVCLAKAQGGLPSGWAVIIFPDKATLNAELEEKTEMVVMGRTLKLSRIKSTGRDRRIPDTDRMRLWLWGESPSDKSPGNKSTGLNKNFKTNMGLKQFGRGGLLMKQKFGGQKGMGMQMQGNQTSRNLNIGRKMGGTGMNQNMGGSRMGQNMSSQGMGQIIGGPGMRQNMTGPGMGQNMGGLGMNQNMGGPGIGMNQNVGGLGMGPNVSGPGMSNPGVNSNLSGLGQNMGNPNMGQNVGGQNMRGPGMGPMMNMGPNIGGPGIRLNSGGPNTSQPMGMGGNSNMNRQFSGMGQNVGGSGNMQNMGQLQNSNVHQSGNVPLSPQASPIGRFSNYRDQREKNRRSRFDSPNEGRDRRFSGGHDQDYSFDRESRTSRFDEREDGQRGFSRERDIDRESNRNWDQDRGMDRSREGQFDDFTIDREGARSSGFKQHRDDVVVKNYDHTSQLEDYGKTVVRDYGHGKLMDSSPVKSKDRMSRPQKYDREMGGKRPYGQRKSEDRSSDRDYGEQKGKKDKGGFEKTLSEKLGVVLSNERHGVQDDRAVVALLQTALNAMQKGSSPSPERSPPRFKSPDRRSSPPLTKRQNSGGMKRKLPQDDKYGKDRNRKFVKKSDFSPKGDFRSQQNKGRGGNFSPGRGFSRGGGMRGKVGRGGTGNQGGSFSSAAAGSESQFQNQNRTQPQQQFQNRPQSQGFSGNQFGDRPLNQNFQSQNPTFQSQGSFDNQYRGGSMPQNNAQASFNQPVFGQQGMQQNPRQNVGGFSQGGQQGFPRYN